MDLLLTRRGGRDIPERVEVSEVAGSGGFPEKALVAVPGRLEPHLIDSESFDGSEPVKRSSALRQPLVTQEDEVGEGELAARQGMGVPPVVGPQALTGLAHGEPESTGEIHPLDEAFLQPGHALVTVAALFLSLPLVPMPSQALEGLDPTSLQVMSDEKFWLLENGSSAD